MFNGSVNQNLHTLRSDNITADTKCSIGVAINYGENFCNMFSLDVSRANPQQLQCHCVEQNISWPFSMSLARS